MCGVVCISARLLKKLLTSSEEEEEDATRELDGVNRRGGGGGGGWGGERIGQCEDECSAGCISARNKGCVYHSCARNICLSAPPLSSPSRVAL
jgi:hypothetical protein